MKICPTCQGNYPNNYAICPADGSPLQEGTWSEGSIIRGKYKLIAKVGQGGMGSVYKALHLAFDELRALKVIAPELLSDELFVKRFKHEAVITRRLQHPNAVRVDDIDEAEDGRPYIVMEFIDGKSLKKLIREEGPLPVPRVLSIIRQSASALDAAHKLGMVHRDIKPDNIALLDTPDGEMVKVLDFGIAKVKEARLGEGAGLTLTGAGVVIGTPQYMSPEQAMGKRGDELDGRADLYSLGVVMYQMLTADLPFKADTTMEMLLAHMQKPPSPIEVLHPELHVPKDVAALTMRLLEKNRDLRPASGRVLIQEIEKLERESIPGKTQVVPPDELVHLNEGRKSTGGDGGAPPWTAPPPRPQPVPVPGPGRQPEPLKVVPPPPVRPQPPDAFPPAHLKPKEPRWGMWVALIVLCVGLGGGGLYILLRPSSGGTVSATLTADPGTVEKGHSVTLHWSAQNATDLDLEPGVGKVQPEGSTSVTPQESTTYTLTATGRAGTQNSTAYVSVSNPVTPPVKPPENINPPQTVNPPQENTTDQGKKPHDNKTRITRKPEFIIPVVVSPPVQGPDPRAVKASITMGDFHLSRGEYDDAIASYQKGLQLDPSNSVLRQKLAGAINTCKIESKILGESFRCGAN
jgi:serine/threonine-protein kinase